MVVKLTQTTQKGGRGQHSPSMPGQLPDQTDWALRLIQKYQYKY